ncbi:MAG: ATP-binding protein, partial [Negativicutes bacterium]|nr:ATP-binding protein [Negativicutes bacterium]
VEWVPSAGAFIGGDTVADLWATVWQQPEISNQMLVDIGTNGEVVLAAGGRLLATSAAAGPAFEGWGLSCGCRAVPGAIERVTIDDRDRMAVKTIGELPARGICGSGIISFIAEARRRGWLDHSGRFRPDRLTESGRRLTAVDGGRRLAACELADGVYVTEQDIANVLAAKAAVAAGWQVLLKLADLPADDIGRICLAGGFAAFLDVPAAISIGLLPAVEPDRYQIAHQAVLRGTAALFSPHNRPRIALLSRRLEVIQMSGRSDFAALFVDNLTLP